MCNFSHMPNEQVNLTTTDVAVRYGVSPFTVRRWVERGRLKASFVTPGGHYRFTEADIAALAASSVKASA